MSNSCIPYILIAGQGRSGTNWLLNILDLCENTWCRNEPNRLVGSALSSIGNGTLINDDNIPSYNDWSEAILKTSNSFGNRDNVAVNQKIYYRNKISRLLTNIVLDKPRVRRPFENLFPFLKAEEWTIPCFLLSQDQAKQRYAVIKINQAPALSSYVLEKDNSGKVIHILRHPGGFLNSWKNRYLKHRNPETVLKENKCRLSALAETSEEWRIRMGDINSLSLPETELWYWLYANEETYRKGFKNERYLLVVFEKLASDFFSEVERILEFSSLCIPETQKSKLSKLGSDSPVIADSWRQALSEAEKDAVAKIMENNNLPTQCFSSR